MKTKRSALMLLALFVLATPSKAEPPRVSCSPEDQKHLYAKNHDFAESIYACSGLRGLDVDCFNKKYKGLSKDCVDCYAATTSCSVRKCIPKCMFSPRGIGCRDCVRAKCGEPLQACIGLPIEDSPDFER